MWIGIKVHKVLSRLSSQVISEKTFHHSSDFDRHDEKSMEDERPSQNNCIMELLAMHINDLGFPGIMVTEACVMEGQW